MRHAIDAKQSPTELLRGLSYLNVMTLILKVMLTLGELFLLIRCSLSHIFMDVAVIDYYDSELLVRERDADVHSPHLDEMERLAAMKKRIDKEQALPNRFFICAFSDTSHCCFPLFHAHQ